MTKFIQTLLDRWLQFRMGLSHRLRGYDPQLSQQLDPEIQAWARAHQVQAQPMPYGSLQHITLRTSVDQARRLGREQLFVDRIDLDRKVRIFRSPQGRRVPREEVIEEVRALPPWLAHQGEAR